MPYIPKGCDQQGRYPDRMEPAEASTDLGTDDYDAPSPVRQVLIDVGMCCAVLAVIYLILWAVIYG